MKGFQTPDSSRRAMRRDVDGSDATHLLKLQGGRWVLETSRLVPIDRDVMRQEAERIVGAEAVLDHLRRIDHGRQLAQNAAELMRHAFDDEASTFGAFGGDWLPIEQRDPSPRQEPLSLAELKESMAEMRAELLLLRGSHQRLRQRVAELEKARHLAPLSAREPALEPRSERIALVAARVPTPAPESVQMNTAAAQATLTPATVSSAQAAPVEAPRIEPGPMGLPLRAELLACLKTLLGSSEDFAPASEELPTISTALFASALCDDSREEVGAVLLDARAVAELGGTLLGVPAPAIEEQAKSGKPSEDCLCAASEVCNNLSGVVNRGAASCHVTAGELGPHTEGALSWLANWSQRSIALATPSGGRLWLLAR